MALALLCDIRIMASEAFFHASFIRRGLSNCDVGVSWLLPRLVGFSRAADVLLSGGSLDAQEAERIGLVSSVVPGEQPLDTALDRASTIAENSPFGVWMTKEVLWSNLETSQLPGRCRAREPHADPRLTDRGSPRSGDGVPRETPGRLRKPLMGAYQTTNLIGAAP